MAVISAKYVENKDYVVVTWANVSSADTAASHFVRGKPELPSVQFEGTFNGGTVANLTGSLSNVAFVAATDMTQTNISKTSNAACGIMESFLYFKPVIASGSADSITISLSYWLR